MGLAQSGRRRRRSNVLATSREQRIWQTSRAAPYMGMYSYNIQHDGEHLRIKAVRNNQCFSDVVYSPLSFTSRMALPAILKAPTHAGTPTLLPRQPLLIRWRRWSLTIVCRMASEILSSASQLLMAPLVCAASSGPRLSAIEIPIFSKERCFRSSCGLPHDAQQTSVTYSCPGPANGSEPCC
jgi:hypothetical protein